MKDFKQIHDKIMLSKNEPKQNLPDNDWRKIFE